MKLLLTILIIISWIYFYSQNLVPNSGFEGYVKSKNGYYFPNEWICVASSPQYIISKIDSAFNFGNISNNGVVTRCVNDLRSSYKNVNHQSNCVFLHHNEAVGTFLKEKLEKDSCYFLEFDVTNFEYVSHFTKYIGLFLSPGIEEYRPKGRLMSEIKPAISSSFFIKSSEIWYTVSGLYYAKGYENFVTIGRTIYPLDFSKCLPSNDTSNSKNNCISLFVDNIKIMKYSYYLDSMRTMLLTEKKIVFSDINFELNSCIIDSNSYKTLDRIVDILKTLPKKRLLIIGNTDNSGIESQNRILSMKRAESVISYLVSKGIDKDRLKAIGNGSSNPLFSNNTEYGRYKNRRVEIELIE